ncbi:MAG: DUF4954 family protein [Planctomycetota bacterium]
MAETSQYRKLTTEEITAMRQQGCSVAEDDWSRIEVADGFQAALVENARFGGEVRLGALGGPASGAAGGTSRIRNASLVNCRLGNHVRMDNIGVRVSGYDIGDGAAIENVGLLEASDEATFGNGVEVEVLNEGGGREVVLFDGLSSQFAHMLCLYRYRPAMVEKMQEMVTDEVRKARQARGRIGAGARVRSTNKVVDVRVGPAAVIDGAALLENGSILSSPAAPTEVGAGVEAHDFIIAEGARVDSAAMLAKTYVGQASRVGRQFSAEGSLFFANCEAFHGEACSVFAGPYTVTHHKGSLLIAGVFSFYNAGSGTNQSNHMYKLGPVHEGRLERGSKTGSFSYVMWPCRLGPFSVVLGKHSRCFDTGDFPFSHVEALPDGRCSLVPGFNLTTVGTVRDGAKWPSRDRRAGSKRDRVSFDVFSPYTVGRMLRGIDRLQDLQNRTDRSVKTVTVGGADVKRVFLRTGQKLFRRGSLMYLAERIVQRVEAALEAGTQPITDALQDSRHAVYSEQWVDVGGQLMPAARLTKLVDEIADGTVSDLARFNARLDQIQTCYPEDEWVWVKTAYQKMTGVNVNQATPRDLAAIADTFLVNRREFLEAVLVDAMKEFEQQSAIGFGTDGPPEAKELDFQAVRGVYDSNKFVVQLRAEIESLAQRVERLKQQVCPSRD